MTPQEQIEILADYWLERMIKNKNRHKAYRYESSVANGEQTRHKWRIKRMQTNKRNKRLVDWQHVVSFYYAVNKIGYR
jgi:hypothetical protein